MPRRSERDPTRTPVETLVDGVVHHGTYSVDRGVVTVNYMGMSKSTQNGHMIAEHLLRELVEEGKREAQRQKDGEAAYRARRAGHDWAEKRGEYEHVEGIATAMLDSQRDLWGEVGESNPGRALLRAVFREGADSDDLLALWANELGTDSPGRHLVQAFASGVVDWWEEASGP